MRRDERLRPTWPHLPPLGGTAFPPAGPVPSTASGAGAVVPRLVPPRAPNGRPIVRHADELHALLSAEGTWIRAWVRARASSGAWPDDPDDSRWLSDPDLDALLARLRADPERRGVVRLWMAELAVLTVDDVPPGVRLVAEFDLPPDPGPTLEPGVERHAGGAERQRTEGIVHRGAGDTPFAVEVDLSVTAEGWHGALDLRTYMRLIQAALQLRMVDDRDIQYGYEEGTPRGATVRCRLRILRTEREALAALVAAQAVLTAVRHHAEAALAGARRAVRDALAELDAWRCALTDDLPPPRAADPDAP